MKILIIGGHGHLGTHLQAELSHNNKIIVPTKKDLNILNEEQVCQYVKNCDPDWIIHSAALTSLYYCETHPDEASLVNVLGSANIASVANECGAKLTYISTYYVYQSDTIESLGRTEDEKIFYNEIPDIYTKTKWLGEAATLQICPKALICRIGSLYGGLEDKKFVGLILNRIKNKQKLELVEDRFIQPTWARDVARVINQLIKYNAEGIYNVVSNDYGSFYDYGRIILDTLEVEGIDIQPTASDIFVDKVPRRRFVLADNTKLIRDYNIDMPSWDGALVDYIREIKEDVLNQ